MNHHTIGILLSLLMLAACQSSATPTSVAETTQPPTASPLPLATAPLQPTSPPPTNSPDEPTAIPADDADNSGEPTAPPTDGDATIPSSNLFDIPWDDRTVFRDGLIEAERGVLDGLTGASVYHLELNISADLLHLQGREEVRYTNLENEPLNEIYFRLYPNLLGGSATVSNLTVNDLTVEPSFESAQSALRVPLPQPLQPGGQIVVQMDFTVEIPGEGGANYGIFVLNEGVLTLAHVYPQIAVYDDEGWNTEIPPQIGDVLYADTSFYLVRVRAPADQTVVASGLQIDQAQTGDEQVLTFAAGPVRDFYLVTSDGYTAVSRTIGETTVNSYTLPDLDAGAELALDFAVDSLQSFSTRFGEYPFTEFDLVGTPTSALGVEYPGIVAITLDIYDPDRRFGNLSARALLETTTVHEVAHQWWYSVVGNDQIEEPWLDEALTQYSTLLYYGDVYGSGGAQGFRGSLEGRWDRVERADIPIGLPVAAYDDRTYGAIVYGRGPLFFEALTETIGVGTFDKFLRDYFQTYQWGIATTADLKQVAEGECDCDLTPLFEAWVNEKK